LKIVDIYHEQARAEESSEREKGRRRLKSTLNSLITNDKKNIPVYVPLPFDFRAQKEILKTSQAYGGTKYNSTASGQFFNPIRTDIQKTQKDQPISNPIEQQQEKETEKDPFEFFTLTKPVYDKRKHYNDQKG
jgi:hypothetical protein